MKQLKCYTYKIELAGQITNNKNEFKNDLQD
jgi:hypothetical protein